MKSEKGPTSVPELTGKINTNLAIGQMNKESLQPEDKTEALVHPGPGGEDHLNKGEVGGEPEQPESAKGSCPSVQPAPVVENVAGDGDATRCNGHCWLEEEENRLVSVQRHLLLNRVPDQVLQVMQGRDDKKDPNEEAAVDAVCILEEQVAKMFAKHGKLCGELVGLVDVQEPAKPFAASGKQPTPTKAEEHKLHPFSWSLLSMLFLLMISN